MYSVLMLRNALKSREGCFESEQTEYATFSFIAFSHSLQYFFTILDYTYILREIKYIINFSNGFLVFFASLCVRRWDQLRIICHDLYFLIILIFLGNVSRSLHRSCLLRGRDQVYLIEIIAR